MTQDVESSAVAPRGPSRRLILHAAAILAAASLCYANSFHVPFQFDDRGGILDNHRLQALSHFLGSGPLSISLASNTRYFGWLSFALNYRLNGWDVVGYHLVNLGIHLTNALLVWTLVRLLWKTPQLASARSPAFRDETALLSGLVFAVHPLQTQAVTYLSQRFTSLATLFYVGSAVAYLAWRLEAGRGPAWRRWGLYASSVLCALLAVRTKEISFTLPLSIGLVEALFFEGRPWRRLAWLLPHAVAAASIPLALVQVNQPLGQVLADAAAKSTVQTTIPRLDYLATELPVVVTYLRLLFLPVKQNIDYDVPVRHSFLAPPVAASALLLVILLGGTLLALARLGPRRPWLRVTAFGVLWFFVTLSVESSVVPIVDFLFEHRAYLPSVGAILAIVTTLWGLSEPLRTRSPLARRAAPAVAAVLVATLGAATFARNRIWRDPITLWEDASRKSPAKSRPYSNISEAYLQRGDIARAVPYYEKAAAVEPHQALVRTDLGYLYSLAGRPEEGIASCSAAIAIAPGYASAYYCRGLIQSQLGHKREAIDDYTAAVARDPQMTRAYMNRGNVYDDMGLPQAALRDYDTAIALDPLEGTAFFNRGLTLERLARRAEALRDYAVACDLGIQQACGAQRTLQTSP